MNMPIASTKATSSSSGSGPAFGSIAESVFNQMKMAGQPRTTTTTVEEPIIDEPLNIGQLGLLTMLLLQKSQPQQIPVGDAAAGGGGLSTDQINELWQGAGGISGNTGGGFSLAGNYGGQ
jgi:hypothetical protein